ncbi:MAG: DUF1629 domain-containing protein [Chitinophagaceae bacterium]
MSKKYFKIEDDLEADNRWMLGNLNLPENIAWDDIEAKSLVDIVDWTIEIFVPGDPLDVTVIDFGLLMATKQFIDLLPSNEIEYNEIKVKNFKSHNRYFLISVKNSIDCVDKKKSRYKIWEANNEVRPDLAGQYEYFTQLRVDPKKIYPYSICLVKGYEVVRLISEEIRDKFEMLKLKGIKFSDV